MLKWKSEFELGLTDIDDQHKRLIEIANEAYKVLKDEFIEDKYDKIVSIIHELEDYTVYHFKKEEEYMKSIMYDDYFSHKIEHRKFIEKLQSLDLEKIDEDQDGYILDLLNFISDWLIDHILKRDKKIVNK